MNFKKSLVIAALCCATGASFAAGGSFALTGGTGSFTSVINPNTSFSDIWSFTLPSYAVGTKGSVFSFFSADDGDINFTSISLSGGSLTSPVAFTPIATGPGVSEMFTLSVPQQISPGAYSITLIGANQSNASASYTGSIRVTAVPEPSGVAVALAGFGVFAALISRRRDEKTEV